MDQHEMNAYVAQLLDAAPRIKWRMQCYHTSDEDDRVVTHTATMEYEFRTWKDMSAAPELAGFHKHRLTKIAFRKEFTFADGYTRNHYQSELETFKLANRRYFDITAGILPYLAITLVSRSDWPSSSLLCKIRNILLYIFSYFLIYFAPSFIATWTRTSPRH